MTTLYVKSAGGNSNAAATYSNINAAGVDNSGPPGIGDDVIAELASGNLTINAALSMKSFSTIAGTGSWAGTLTHNAGINWTVAGSITFNSGTTYTPTATSTVTLSAANTLTSAGKLFPLMALTSGLTTLGDNLSMFAAKTITMTLSGNLLDLNGKTIAGNSAINRLLITSNTIGTARTITINSGTFNACDFKDITASSAIDLSVASNYSGNAGGNTNITFTTSAGQTWSGTTGGNASTNAWSSRVPLPQDNALLGKAFSAGQTITMDMPRSGKSIDLTGATGTPALTFGNTSLFGSLTLISGMTLPATTGNITFEGRSAYTLTSAGLDFKNYNLFITVPVGSLTLQDALLMSVGSKFVTLTNGTFDANGFSVTIQNLDASTSNTCTLNIGSGAWNIADTSGSVWRVTSNAALTLNAGTSTIFLSNTSSSGKTFAGGGKTYNDLKLAGGGAGAITITGANTFNRIYTNGGGTKSVVLPGSTTTTIVSGLGLANGTNVITFTASAGSATVSKSGGGTVGWDYVNLTNIPAAQATTWYAGTHSTNGGGNTNWNFSDPPVTYTANVSVTIKGATLSASATFVKPSYTGTSSLVTKGSTLAANATFTKPVYSGTSVLTVGHTTLVSSATFTKPQYTGTSVLITKGSVLAANTSFTKPSYAATIVLTVGGTALLASSSFTKPVYSATSVLIIGGPLLTAHSTFAKPSYSGNSNLAIGPVVLQSLSTFNKPTYAGSGILSMGGPVLTAFASFVSTTVGGRLLTLRRRMWR